MVGIPFVRLACALPPAFLGGTCSPLSALGLPSAVSDDVSPACGVQDSPPDVHEMASTAFMHALMQSYCYASAEEVFDQQRAYAARLRRHALSEEVSPERFFFLFAALKELLISGGLSSDSRWMQAARLWQCVLAATPCQAGAGVQWAPTRGLALALLALRSRVASGPPSQPSGLVGLAMRLQAWASFAANVAAGGVVTGGFVGGEQQTMLSHLYEASSASQVASSSATRVAATADKDATAPLAAAEAVTRLAAATKPERPVLSPAFDFDVVALLEAAPDCLSGFPELWVTACVTEALGTLDVGWAPESLGTPGGAAFPTLAHAAAAGVDAMLASAQAAGVKLSAEELRAAARLAVHRWSTQYEVAIVRTRAAAVLNARHQGNVVRRALGSLALQLVTQHPTFGPLTSPEFVCARRWIAFSAIGAGIIAGLTCSIWIFSSKATTCWCVRAAAHAPRTQALRSPSSLTTFAPLHRSAQRSSARRAAVRRARHERALPRLRRLVR